MRKAYAVFSLLMVTLFGMAEWRGWGLSAVRRGVVPADVRQSPGGYRSYSFWRGGK